jgi:hypothetical protein
MGVSEVKGADVAGVESWWCPLVGDDAVTVHGSVVSQRWWFYEPSFSPPFNCIERGGADGKACTGGAVCVGSGGRCLGSIQVLPSTCFLSVVSQKVPHLPRRSRRMLHPPCTCVVGSGGCVSASLNFQVDLSVSEWRT